MQVSQFDIAVIALFIILTTLFFKSGWFFSFYTFVKFVFIVLLSLAVGLIASNANPYSFLMTKLQFALLIQALTFIMLWMSVSFEKFFFPVSSRLLNVNRFIFTHKIDRFLNIVPSASASIFICFFIFTITVSLSTRFITLAHAIENSDFVKPLAYKIYNADLPLTNGLLFEGIAYKLVPAVNPPNLPAYQTPISESSPTLTPLPTQKPGSVQTFIPPTQVPTNTPTPTIIPSPTPQRFNPGINVPSPTPTRVPTPTRYIPPTSTPKPPTSTPVPTIIIYQPTPPPVYQPQPVNSAQVEQDIFRLTNLERVKNGLVQLAWSDALASVARAHSQDMVSRNFFSHINPDGLDPYARMSRAGISYTAAAENIAAAATADLIVQSWMNSPGHRANILNPLFGKIGIGVVADSKYGIMATQNFTN